MASPYHITADIEAISECLRHAPHYHACILGPVPFGQENRILLSINAMVVPSLEDAEMMCWEHIRRACEEYKYEFDSDEWEIVHLKGVNLN